MSRDEIRLMSFTPGKFWISLQAEVLLTSTVEIGNWKQASNPWISPLSANKTLSPKPRKRPSGGEKIRFPFISEVSSSPQQCFDMVEWLPMNHFPSVSPSNFPLPYVRCWARGGKTQITFQWSNLTDQIFAKAPAIVLAIFGSVKHHLTATGVRETQQAFKAKPEKKIELLLVFFFSSGSICIERRAADWSPSDWYAISWWSHWPWMPKGAFLCIVSFVYLTSCIYRFAECSVQFANDCLIQLAPSSRFLWCGANPASRPIMTAQISAKPFLNCPQGWQGNINIRTNSDITKKTLTSWHLSLPVLGQLLTVYFLELNPVWS